MRLHFGFAALVIIAAPAKGTEEPAEVNIAAIVAPVTNAVAQEKERQSQLPPPASIREQLERMGRLDQVGRWAIAEINFRKLSIEEGRRVNDAIGEAIEPIDQANVQALLKIMPEEGWFTISEFGPEASEAAFHIVQHSDLALKRVLPRLEPLATSGEIDGTDYAFMVDRVATGEGRPQRYGTQFRCREGKLESYPIESIEKAEELRRSLNFEQTLAESLAMQVDLVATVTDRSSVCPSISVEVVISVNTLLSWWFSSRVRRPVCVRSSASPSPSPQPALEHRPLPFRGPPPAASSNLKLPRPTEPPVHSPPVAHPAGARAQS